MTFYSMLKMPRGNLETIYPRAIVIAAVESLLDTKNFRKAFLTLRRHRIDLNVLYDHNPEAFTENCAEFVEQLESPNYINLFLSDLKDQDIKKKLFPNDRSSKKREEVNRCTSEFVPHTNVSNRLFPNT